MSFTDDDLKRLKDLIQLHHVSDAWTIKSLIARLEAAEACIEVLRKYKDRDDISHEVGVIDTLTTWGKVAGK